MKYKRACKILGYGNIFCCRPTCLPNFDKKIVIANAQRIRLFVLGDLIALWSGMPILSQQSLSRIHRCTITKAKQYLHILSSANFLLPTSMCSLSRRIHTRQTFVERGLDQVHHSPTYTARVINTLHNMHRPYQSMRLSFSAICAERAKIF